MNFLCLYLSISLISCQAYFFKNQLSCDKKDNNIEIERDDKLRQSNVERDTVST